MPEFVIMTYGTPQKNSQRVLRGGSWINNARNLRSANRNANSPDNRNHNIGLRLAGALLNLIYGLAKLRTGGSINQWCFLFSGCSSDYQKRNQDPQRVSKQMYLEMFQYSKCNAGAFWNAFPRSAWVRVVESLLLGRLFLVNGYCHAC